MQQSNHDVMSGNIRLETKFIRNASPAPQPQSSYLPTTGEVFSSNVTPIRQSEVDGSALGARSSSIAKELENKSAIGRLDDLITDFNKPYSSAENVNEF